MKRGDVILFKVSHEIIFWCLPHTLTDDKQHVHKHQAVARLHNCIDIYLCIVFTLVLASML